MAQMVSSSHQIKNTLTVKDLVRTDFTSYVREVEEINTRLEAIAHPPSRHHRHHHSSFFYSCSPHHHRDKEVAPFHEIRLKWENIRDGIGHSFAQFRYRLKLEAEKKDMEKKAKDKIEEDKKKEKEKADDKLKKEKEKAEKAKKKTDEKLEEEKAKAKKTADRLKKKLEERQQEGSERLALKEKHEQAKLAHVEEIAEKRDFHVEKLLQNKIEEDPIDQVRKVAGIFKDLQQSVVPNSTTRGSN